MAMATGHPKRCKKCVFCKYWIGDAKMKFVNSTVGYSYEHATQGACTKRNTHPFTHETCSYYTPSMDAEKLL